MNSLIRVIVVVFVLIGGTVFFGYWSVNEFDNVFDNLSASSLASSESIYLSFKQNKELASTSVIYGEIATSTLATSTNRIILVTSTTTIPLATSTKMEISFIFPQKGENLYIGCIYEISFKSSVKVVSLETTLIDAGKRESISSIMSGLVRENTIETGLQNLKWKVGDVWPGEYYIKVLKANDVEAEFKSKVFEVNKFPKGISTVEKNNICKKSGGLF